MEITRILHTSMNVKGSLDKCDAFYEEFLGLSATPRPTIEGIGGRWFGISTCQVHLVDAQSFGHGIDPVGPHVCFGVTDLAGAKAELDAKGIEFLAALQTSPTKFDGDKPLQVEQIWFVDPAGNTIELQQDSFCSKS